MTKAITNRHSPRPSKERQPTMLRRKPVARRHEAGQAIVLMALAMVAILAMTALVIDGGNAFVQQRDSQNGADAAAEAGAIVLAQNLAGGGHSDQDVLAAVTASATKNHITLASALYTNINGNSLGIAVGSLGAGAMPPTAAAGVRAFGSRSFGTYFGGVVGITNLSANARATAVAGATASCSSSQGCTLLPITFPVNPTICDGTGNQIQVGTGPYQVVDITKRNSGNEAILGICKTQPGSVGWLDFAPPLSSCGNGQPGIICEINNPPTSITFPIWLQTETGNTNSKPVTDAVNQFDGQIVDIPFYDCWKDNVGQLSPGPACPSPAQKGTGKNTYYHVVGFYGFYLDKAYINGNNPECNQAPGKPAVGGNGGTGCLKGWFVQPLSAGAVGWGPYVPGDALSVQLVR